MSVEPNPYAPPGALTRSHLIATPEAIPLEEPLAESWIVEKATEPKWRAKFYEQTVFLHPPDGRPILRISFEDFLSSSELLGGTLLVVRQPKTTSFNLEGETVALFQTQTSDL